MKRKVFFIPSVRLFSLYSIELLVLFLPIVFIIYRVLLHTHGVFMYPFDDSFIHLTIADNLVKGNWGINENEFASASSSILYTLILAFFRLFSNSVLVPFIVNCLGGITIIVSLRFWLRKHLVNYVGQVIIFLLVVFLTPLPLLIVSGMEHTLQCLFSFLFVFYFSDWMEEAEASEKKALEVKVVIFGVLAASVRYEGLFLIAIACVLLLLHGKVVQSLVLGGISSLPLLIFGLISLKHGNYILPNSVLIKSGSFDYGSPFRLIYAIIFERWVYARNGLAALATQRLLIILPLLYLIFKKSMRRSYFFILVFLFCATILQLSFASTGTLYRYEAYLFFCLAIILPVVFYKYGSEALMALASFLSKAFALTVIFFLFLPVILRSASGLGKTTRACINIYDQQYQMAMFVRKNYNGNAVAFNDIGAAGYYTDAKIIDLWGLGNIDIARSKKQHYWTPSFLDSFCKKNDVTIAIVYDSWIPDALTRNWTKAATWQIQKNVVCGDSTVSFYSLDPFLKDSLQQHLKTFQQQLPHSVFVKYY